jgi:hypothetical protein
MKAKGQFLHCHIFLEGKRSNFVSIIQDTGVSIDFSLENSLSQKRAKFFHFFNDQFLLAISVQEKDF